MEYEAFRQLAEQRGVSIYRISKATGIPASTFTDWKNGRSAPKADKLLRIAEFFGMGLEELMRTERGERTEQQQYAQLRSRRRLPVIGEIRAGSPIITNETVLGYEFADVEDTDDYFYLRICGDSMKDCGMVDGALVLFHKQQYAEDGDVVACLVGGESATVKRFFKRQRRIELVPENEAYRPIVLSGEDFEMGEARILGVAREIKIKL